MRKTVRRVGWLVGIAPTTVVGERAAMNVHSDKT